jgi:predicted dehydrogenase
MSDQQRTSNMETKRVSEPVAAAAKANRRQFLQKSSAATVGAAMLGPLLVPRNVHAAQNEVLKVGLIGAGGRGTGAAADALHADPATELTAIGDTFIDQAQRSRKNLLRSEAISERVKVDDDHLFVGFDAYKQVIDSGVDVVILTTAPHFRPDQLEYAVERGKHCFVEKPIAVDVPGVLRVEETCRRAEAKGLAVVSGLCWRYHPAVVETVNRVRDGAIGDIIAIESHYNAGTLWHRGRKPEWSQMEYQIRNWLYYTWLSGDHIAEQAVHSLDKTAWLQGDVSPVAAMGIGGRQQRTAEQYGHVYDHFTVFYEYESGIRVFFTCRQQDHCSNFVDEIVLGTKGTAQILANTISPHDGPVWKYEPPRGADGAPQSHNMYQLEHQAMFRSIRDGNPINNGHYMCNSTMLAVMGRLASYTGQTLSWDECRGNTERLGPTEYSWSDMPKPEVAIPGVRPEAQEQV